MAERNSISRDYKNIISLTTLLHHLKQINYIVIERVAVLKLVILNRQHTTRKIFIEKNEKNVPLYK